MSRAGSWRGLLRSLRKDSGTEARSILEAETGLWSAHQSASAGSTSALEACAQVATASARQRKVLEALLETARSARARADEAAPAATRLGDALDRLRLVALNLGLEGARVSDSAGRALTAVSDEIRAWVDRSAEALSDLQGAIEELRPASGRVIDHAEQLRQIEADIANGAARTQAGAQQAAQSLEELGRWASKLSETDPETARVLSRAADHARALVADLSELQTAARGEIARSVLEPIIDPLTRLIAELGSKRSG